MWTEERFWPKVDRRGPDECWPWKRGRSDTGYGSANYQDKSGKIVGLKAHRVAWSLWHGEEIHPKWMILHSCDNPLCCNPAHLRLGTHQDNMDDMKARGRGRSSPKVGVLNNQAKLDETQALEIRRRYDSGESPTKIAGDFDVNNQTICKIGLRQRWAHLT